MPVSSFSLPAVPHAVIPQQIAAPQPPVWLLVVAYLIPANLLSVITGWLLINAIIFLPKWGLALLHFR